MRRRVHPTKALDRSNAFRVEVIPVDGAGRLVTLEDPRAPSTLAQDAFCRLRPGEAVTPDQVASWRDSVARVARAVRVVPAPRAAAVALDAARVGEGERVGTFREEATALARETKAPDVEALVLRLLDEVEA